MLDGNVLNELLSFEEFFEMSHLPGPHDDEDDGLGQRPPQDTLICALARLPETLLTIL